MSPDPAAGFDPALIARYNVSGPRYTSYPTALQFEPFAMADLDDIILGSPFAGRDISLYLHIPFCAKLCYYCACNKIVTRKYGLVAPYLAALETEIDLYASRLGGRKVSQLHLGGGTPTYLDNMDLAGLIHYLQDTFDFADDESGEFGIEIDPRTVTPDRIDHLREIGFNRLSMGIQDFDPVVQKAVNRVQSFEETEAIIQRAQDCGFKSISVDLIYGLPFQTLSSFSRTLDDVVQLSPDRISIFNYAHLPERFTPQKRILATDLPSPKGKLQLLELCIEVLTGAGYIYIGMDHFAKPEDELSLAQNSGSLHRNFQGYSTQAETDMFAFGVTSISHVGRHYWQNNKDLEAYERCLVDGRLPIERGVAIDDDDQIRKHVIQQLICQFALNFEEINQHFQIDFPRYFASEMAQLDQFFEDGLIERKSAGIQVTDTGRYLIRNICMVFDRYISGAPSISRYSKAL